MTAPLPRLKRRRDFLRVAGARRKCARPGLVLQVAEHPAENTPQSARPADSPPLPRVGFTCSRKVGNAVRRNRAKRRLRALADEIIAARAPGGYDYVLIGRPATVTRPYPALRRDLETALDRLGLLTPPADAERTQGP